MITLFLVLRHSIEEHSNCNNLTAIRVAKKMFSWARFPLGFRELSLAPAAVATGALGPKFPSKPKNKTKEKTKKTKKTKKIVQNRITAENNDPNRDFIFFNRSTSNTTANIGFVYGI